MLLPLSTDLVVTTKFDREIVALADGHYSRQKPGTNQFMPPGYTLVIRNNEGTIVFGWLRQMYRDDGEHGYNCSIFRNTSTRRSSDVILECEQIAIREWGPGRMFTYVNPSMIRSPNPGYCFKQAGWVFVRRIPGKHLLMKDRPTIR